MASFNSQIRITTENQPQTINLEIPVLKYGGRELPAKNSHIIVE